MTLQFASKLGLEKKKINLAVSGLSENSTNIKWKINDAFISNNDSSYTSPLDFLIVPRITDFVPSIQPNLKIKRFNDINRSILADPSFDKPGKIDMIIGAELFYQILKDGRKCLENFRELGGYVLQLCNVYVAKFPKFVFVLGEAGIPSFYAGVEEVDDAVISSCGAIWFSILSRQTHA
ncbi:DUF1758 domain-containing protein [Trichonephila clavata]|uniref:DUF1758 domain-containing protein n=1 Tax=Trichonephila clavata TaxID=2740835 RepID=A0A8X6I2Z2_TRICU|nr:DUF1758 domain-containing protein [Trichonephila clavata]